ncbi:ribonuclease [Dinoroseobacter shibae DFL 12 = DSM 16493]|jgi:Ribonuclease G/E|uniref:Ribonuclease n=1 Tax=Dinoroseobacter shibae (strain DSM 16493 / NCIMB 14021 / DFL 12) TaxID=398580 RepID=A8LS19_DINSH|nr:ribonuclease E/G [Dinoroseobacter shibae]ABV92726.1 ribonuclease [Dinoroseobacter shibae DFL 12 = DSM 16493]URF47665.1 ribonuclease E/G [Dinoroseobacter shibae]URF51975.1 ribonuclease E/G [Dinoroseobacter shibae]
MKGNVIVLDHLGARRAAARLTDGRLEDLAIDPAEDAPPLPGAIFRAVIDRPVKGQGGAFVKLDGAMGFLRGGSARRPGDRLLVQVSGVAEPGKAVPVTDRVLYKSRYVIVTPNAPGVNVARSIREEERRASLRLLAEDVLDGADTGLILRSAAAQADEDTLREDISETLALAMAVQADAEGEGSALLLDAPDAHHLAWRDWSDPVPDEIVTDPGGFERHGVLDALHALVDPQVSLSGGASVFIEPTRALVAVDVNTGRDVSPAAGLKANLAAARALPRQLRLRGLGGQIVVDFAPMPKKDRKQLEQSLRAAFRADPVETSLVGWTPLGHYELQRKRDRASLRRSDLP